MIIKHGIDLVNIQRIENLYIKYGSKFLNKIFTNAEIAYANSNKTNYISILAKRFAAKEAFAKAIGFGIGHIAFKDIEIHNNTYGAPNIIITNKISKLLLLNNNNKINCSLSLTDENNMAVASVIIIVT